MQQQPPAAQEPAKKSKTAKKPSHFLVPAECREQLVYIFVDIETTSNQRKQYDRIIELAVIAYSHDGVELAAALRHLHGNKVACRGGGVSASRAPLGTVT